MTAGNVTQAPQTSAPTPLASATAPSMTPPVAPGYTTTDVVETTHRVAGHTRLPTVTPALIQQTMREVVPQVQELTGLSLGRLPRIQVVAADAMLPIVTDSLQRDSGVGPEAWERVRKDAQSCLGPKSLWKKLGYVWVPDQRTLVVSERAWRGKNYDTLRLNMFEAVVNAAVHETYPDYERGADAAWKDYVAKLDQFRRQKHHRARCQENISAAHLPAECLQVLLG